MCAAGLAAVVGAPAAAAPDTSAVAVRATQTVVTFYSFNTVSTTSVLDTSHHGRNLQIRSADGGGVRYVPRAPGQALMLPARCVPRQTRCARVVLETPHHASLNPGTQNVRFGAHLIGTGGTVGTGANIVQKGSSPGSQYKLQIGARGKPNCVLSGQAPRQTYLARSTAPVTDGRWHQVTCNRTSSTLYVIVDGVVRGSTPVPATVSVANTHPLRIGARSLADRTDRFGGGVDDIFVTVGS